MKSHNWDLYVLIPVRFFLFLLYYFYICIVFGFYLFLICTKDGTRVKNEQFKMNKHTDLTISIYLFLNRKFRTKSEKRGTTFLFS